MDGIDPVGFRARRIVEPVAESAPPRSVSHDSGSSGGFPQGQYPAGTGGSAQGRQGTQVYAAVTVYIGTDGRLHCDGYV